MTATMEGRLIGWTVRQAWSDGSFWWLGSTGDRVTIVETEGQAFVWPTRYHAEQARDRARDESAHWFDWKLCTVRRRKAAK